MPSYIQQRLSGRGKYRVRAAIEGYPYIFVSDRSLERPLPDGRRQVRGLRLDSLRFAADADMARAELRAQEMSLEIVDKAPDYLATRALQSTPERRTWLTERVEVFDTTIHVASTAGFDSNGVIHIGTEAIRYTGRTATSFTGCTRGYWDTTPQAHVLGDGGETWYPPVTDLPRELTGRRVRFYVYGMADDPSGLGTLRWRGVCRGGLEYSEGLYTIPVDPPTYLLEQQLGGDLGDEVPIRGIYLPSTGCWRAIFGRRAGPSKDDPVAAGFWIELDGHFETTGDLVDELNAQLAAKLPTFGLGAGASLIFVEGEGGDYALRYRTSDVNPHYVVVEGARIKPRLHRDQDNPGPHAVGVSPVDVFAGEVDGNQARWWASGAGGYADELLPASDHEIRFSASVPRASGVRVEGDPFVHSTSRAYPMGRFYLGGSVAVTPGALVKIKLSEDNDRERRPLPVEAVSIAERWVELGEVAHWWPQPGPETLVRFWRHLATGDVGSLIAKLVSDSPLLANTGAMPLIAPDDFALDFTELRAAIAGVPAAADRRFIVSEGVSLGELLAEELKLAGCYLALDHQARIRIKRISVASITDAFVHELGPREIKGSFPRSSTSPNGILGTVIIHQGYDVEEGEHVGPTISVRNTTSPTHLAGTLTIAPLSTRRDVQLGDVEIPPEDAYRLASAVLGVFGESYRIVSVEAGSESEGLSHGDTVLLSSPHLPGGDGRRGMVQQPATLIGYDWSPGEGRGTLNLLIHHRRVAGYSPGFPVVSVQELGGMVYRVQLHVLGYAPTGTSAMTWYAPGDRVRVIERNTRTPIKHAGEIVEVGPTHVDVQLAAPWAAAGKSWRLSYDTAAHVSESPPAGRRWAQSDFAFVADGTQRIPFGGGARDAQEFSP